MSAQIGWFDIDKSYTLRDFGRGCREVEKGILSVRPEFSQKDSNVRQKGWMQVGAIVHEGLSSDISDTMLVDELFYASFKGPDMVIRSWVRPDQSVEGRLTEIFTARALDKGRSFVLGEITMGNPEKIPTELAGVVNLGEYTATAMVGQISLMIRELGEQGHPILMETLAKMQQRKDQGGLSFGEVIGEHYINTGAVGMNQITTLQYSNFGNIVDLADGPPTMLCLYRSVDHPQRSSKRPYLFYFDDSPYRVVWSSNEEGLRGIDSKLSPLIELREGDIVEIPLAGRLLCTGSNIDN